MLSTFGGETSSQFGEAANGSGTGGWGGVSLQLPLFCRCALLLGVFFFFLVKSVLAQWANAKLRLAKGELSENQSDGSCF